MILEIVGKSLMVLGLIFISIGVFGVFRFNDFYSRILITGNIDTVGFMTMAIGLMLRQGSDFFSAKVFIILAFSLLTNPITTHSIAESAYKSGYKTRKVK